MKLYAFQPVGHGEPSFFVCAEDAWFAAQAVCDYMRDNDYQNNIRNHAIRELEPMMVIENDND